jgi:hypothetical protein
MYPISVLRDFLQKDVGQFHATFEEATKDSSERVKSDEAVRVSKTKIPIYLGTTLALLGFGLLSIAAFRDAGSNGPAELGPHTLTCQSMTVSLRGGKLVPGGEAACPAANIRCTTAMMGTSQLCRDKCASWAP